MLYAQHIRPFPTRPPFDVLGKADKNWKREHGDKVFGSSFLAPTPSVWANQQFGLICRRLIFLTTFERPSPKSSITSSDDDNHQADYDGWKFYDGPLDNEPALNDESHGYDTASLEIIDGLLSQTLVTLHMELLR
jgi:hypothetical protein